jgi:hypothetical protein
MFFYVNFRDLIEKWTKIIWHFRQSIENKTRVVTDKDAQMKENTFQSDFSKQNVKGPNPKLIKGPNDELLL